MLEDQGFSTGLGAEGWTADNPFGTRENPDLVRLDKAVLELNGCDWIVLRPIARCVTQGITCACAIS